MARPVRPPRERLSTEERKQQILEAGRTLFLERPYDQVSMDDVAARAGVSKALIFHYFSTKRDLYVELVRRAADQLLVATFVPEEAPPLEKLSIGLFRYLDFVEQNAQGYVALLTSGVGIDPQVIAAVENVRRTLADRILVNLPVVVPNARIAVRGYIGFVEAASIAWLDESGAPKAKKEELVAIFMRVLGSGLGIGA